MRDLLRVLQPLGREGGRSPAGPSAVPADNGTPSPPADTADSGVPKMAGVEGTGGSAIRWHINEV